jgi:hypothetical protein
MKLNWLRIKYQLLALVNPLCWFTNKADREWDKELWDALVRGDIAVVGRFHAGIGDKCVWIENHPYASGSIESPIVERHAHGQQHYTSQTVCLLPV